MLHVFKIKQIILPLVLVLVLSAMAIVGCSDEENPQGGGGTANPNVRVFNNITVEEDSSAFGSYYGINLFTGQSVTGGDPNRDAAMQDESNAGENFYLTSGIYDQLLPPGYETKYFQVSPNMTIAEFDTMAAVYTGIGSSFGTEDFTEDNTAAWGYFNTSSIQTTKPVYCFWLKGRSDAGQNNGKNIFGIIQPVDAYDLFPGQVYGFRATFKVKININGENDFRAFITE
ncbi:MAG TPA: hypothetical protein VGK25_13145 [Ignavibacteria bacterium]|jgi:hypothetical protein